MKLLVHPDAEAAAAAAAETAAGLLREAIARRGAAAFVAASGVSHVGVLARLVAAPGIAWERTTMFHLDEYLGLSADHPGSLRRYLRERLTSRVPVGTAHFIEGDVADPAAEVTRLNRLLAATPIDLALLGIGDNAHLAFNDPPADFGTDAPYVLVDVAEASRRQQVERGWFASLAAVPRRAISMSIRQITKAGALVAVAFGRGKAPAVRVTLTAEIGPAVPASVLRRHPRSWLFLDREAAGEVPPATLAAFA
jgi:glucosamine-6-phosphate deaminase